MNRTYVFVASLVLALGHVAVSYQMLTISLLEPSILPVEADNVSAAGLGLVVIPMLVLGLHVILHLVIFAICLMRYRKKSFMFTMLLPSRGVAFLNVIRALGAVIFLVIAISLLSSNVYPLWMILYGLVVYVVYWGWVLHMVSDRLIERR
ncbi:hypothetical protein SY83_02455 [Paenibacillus swuensis]|uniref:Uncharacterized protein n=1 Tax=Paenibacillus swuensis TaxID=1178515 RepID=A0A172TEP1_9BACL|nr:hypothetical protein [Paenibacillus swuensis]ANE45374.1 hypothetical protein SY83_02455 [Paenibacillus swuensis]